jgi:hypothetical protein
MAGMTTLDLRPLGATFGGDIRGLDVRAIDGATETALRAAIDAHRVLVVRGQALTPAEQKDFSRRFGPLVRAIRTKLRRTSLSRMRGASRLPSTQNGRLARRWPLRRCDGTRWRMVGGSRIKRAIPRSPLCFMH